MEQSHTDTGGVTAKQTWDFTSQMGYFSGRNSSYPQIWGANSTCTSRASEAWERDVPGHWDHARVSFQNEFGISNPFPTMGSLELSDSGRDRKIHLKFSKGRRFITFPPLQCSQSRCWLPFDRFFSQIWPSVDSHLTIFFQIWPTDWFFLCNLRGLYPGKVSQRPFDPEPQITAPTFLLYPGLGLHLEQQQLCFPQLKYKDF